MKPIVVAIGEHDHASPALRWAAELATLTSVPLEVVSVCSPTFAEISPELFDKFVRLRRADLVSVLDEVGYFTADITVTSGEPVKGIVDYLGEHDADLAVVGTHLRHSERGTRFGGSAHHLLQLTHVPVVIVPPGYRLLKGGVIVIGVDGSIANASALRRAEMIARAAGASIHAVFAYNPMDDTFTHPEGWHRHSDDIRAQVDMVSAAPIKLYMAAGHPTEVLLEHAERENASMIVVGTRGHGGFGGLRLGRVPSQLVDHVSSSLLVVPHSAIEDRRA